MDAVLRERVEDEIEQLDVIIKAAERWSKSYTKNRKTHGQLIRNEAKFARALRKYFRYYADLTDKYINWSAYEKELKQVNASRVDAAIDINTIVTGDLFDDMDNTFMSIAFDYISTSTVIGERAGESIYKIKLTPTNARELVQELTNERIAWLVGKRVDKNGKIIDNPNPEYRISDKTREQIMSSIKQSIDLGENRREAASRLTSIIGNPQRAEVIAQTESVNAYGAGLHGFGKESGATGKEWQDVNATDECKTNADAGIIPIDAQFPSGDMHPAAHTGCRCGERIVYRNEYNPDGE